MGVYSQRHTKRDSRPGGSNLTTPASHMMLDLGTLYHCTLLFSGRLCILMYSNVFYSIVILLFFRSFEFSYSIVITKE